ncbi:hypothetical protein [Proteiniphilum sp.]|uniref:hypothetical protein n=1 Tax=Proteiniphilum sp. TaxID=1926877 RepID=UPI002B1F17BF|nr:hypothetical protein [Proteiniphilum sp.]MEA4917163.1 hypothetical protein [Proteiniphilum sp.]
MIAIIMEVLLRNIPNDYLSKKKYLDQYSSEIETLILGNSHAHSGLNPEFFTNNTFNTGYVSQSLDLDYAIFKKYLSQLDNLKTVIVSISYPSLWAVLAETSESWRIKNYNIYYDLKTSRALKYQTELFSSHFILHMTRLRSYYLENKPGIYSTPLGYGINYQSGNPQDLTATGESAAKRHEVKDLQSERVEALFQNNMDILNALLSDCQQRNIKVLFITVPAYRSYTGNLPAEPLEKTIAAMEHLTDVYDHCYYMNLLEDDRFEDMHFFDADHLNEIGARKLSLIVDEIIKSPAFYK